MRQNRRKKYEYKEPRVIAGNRVQKTLSIHKETHRALSQRAYELDLFESDLAEIALCLFLGLPAQLPSTKGRIIANMAELRKNAPQTTLF
jgi:hypothetical protein